MATLYIHIGTPKTGTTAIQNFLLLNEELLERKGIAHPRVEVEGMREKFKSRRNGNFLVFNSPLTGEEKKRQEQQVYQTGFQAVKRAAEASEKVVVTDESIWLRQNIREDFWQRIAEDAKNAGCQVKVIVYLRRQDLYIQALWNQAIKLMTRLDQTFPQYLESDLSKRNYLDYYEKLSNIAQCIGKENLIVRVYEKDIFLNSGGIYQDFLEAVGESMSQEYQIPEKSPNERLEGNYIEIKRIINRIPEYKKMPLDDMYDPMIMASNLRKPEKVSYFSYEEQIDFLKKYEASNRRVAEEFLGRLDGVLFTEPIEKLPQWKIDDTIMYQDIILFYAELAFKQKKETEDLNRKLSQTSQKLGQMNQKLEQLDKKLTHMEKEKSKLSQKCKALEREVHNPVVHCSVLFQKIKKKIKKFFCREKKEVES